jgi:uncharacterized protein
MMQSRELVSKTADFIKKKFTGEGTGHDWWHLYRVWQLSRRIAQEEKGSPRMVVVELAALLHDIADWKFNGGDDKVGPKEARKWLESLNADEETIKQVVYIVENISFKSGLNRHQMQTIEGKIVQDADRLDAIGAVGIARCFATGGSFGRPIYDPSVKLRKYKSLKERYDNIANDTTLNHFYEKLLLLKDMMNTESGSKLAQHRHEYMENYLKEFYLEWEGKV